MTPAERARQIDQEEFAAAAAASRARALAYSQEARARETRWRATPPPCKRRFTKRKPAPARAAITIVSPPVAMAPVAPKPIPQPRPTPIAMQRTQPVAKPHPAPCPKSIPNPRAQLFTAMGRSLTLREWSERAGININTLRARLQLGWSIERAVGEGKGAGSAERAKTFTAHGHTLTLSAWAKRLGMKAETLRNRLALGWPVERALSEPKGANPGAPLAKTYTALGHTRTLREWSEHTGVAIGTLDQRLRKGWPLERVFGQPKGAKGNAAHRHLFRGEMRTRVEIAALMGVAVTRIHQRIKAGIPLDIEGVAPRRPRAMINAMGGEL